MTTTKFRHRVRKTFGTFHFLSEPPLRMASFCTRGGGRIFKSKEPPKNEPFGNFLQKCRHKMNPSDFLLQRVSPKLRGVEILPSLGGMWIKNGTTLNFGLSRSFLISMVFFHFEHTLHVLLHGIFFLFLYTASSGLNAGGDEPPSEYCDAYAVILYYRSFKFYILLSSPMPTTK